MLKLAFIAGGGAIGTLLRYLLTSFINKTSSSLFPLGTLSVNLIGSLVIGLLWGLAERYAISDLLKVFLFIGILGSFTTFSTFSLETMNLLKAGELKIALTNIVLSNVLGIGLAYLGFLLTRR